jgi:hypothetical protein
MHKLIAVSVLIAAASVFCDAAVAAELRFATPQDRASTTNAHGYSDAILLVGGMGTGSGAAGMTGGGMTGGGMTGMTGRGIGGTIGYGGAPSAGGDPYGRSEAASDPSQSTRYLRCVTKHGHCSVSSTPGALQSGASCTCLFGGKGKIK